MLNTCGHLCKCSNSPGGQDDFIIWAVSRQHPGSQSPVGVVKPILSQYLPTGHRMHVI